MHQNLINKKLPKEFYYQDPVELAPKLLGKIIVRKLGSKYLTGKIVEVEAYRGRDDRAAHTYNGKTKRNEVMFREGGYLYVYFTYGMHFCSNIVCGKKDEGAAVLIRAIEPIDEVETMAYYRYGKKIISEKEKINLTNGPAKLCEALNIKREENGLDLTKEPIFLIEGENIPKKEIIAAKRIGIKKSVDLPWRFYIKDNPYVSQK
jgi:DNA-3-methyladenine glycosylase